MTFVEYQNKAMGTCLPESDNVFYMLTGLSEEVGELCGKFSKAKRKGMIGIEDGDVVSNMSSEQYCEWLESVIKEGGDVLWMLSGLFHTLGVSFDEVAVGNIAKLASRAKRGVIDGNGDNR